MFDIEYLLLQIRSKSVGEISKFKVFVHDKETDWLDVELDLSKVNVQVDDEHTNKIVIDEKRKFRFSFKLSIVRNNSKVRM